MDNRKISKDIIWHSDEPPADLLQKTENELFHLLENGLARPSSLVFHTVIDDGNPRVICWGVEDREQFNARWTPDGTWETL